MPLKLRRACFRLLALLAIACSAPAWAGGRQPGLVGLQRNELPLLVTAIGLAVWGALYLIFGREYHASDVPRYLREPDDWKPIEVGYVWRWGELSVTDLTAVTMDLVRRGVLRLVTEGAGAGGPTASSGEASQYLQWVQDDQEGPSPSERYLITQILFPDASVGCSKVITDIHAAQAMDPPRARARFFHWQDLATAECQHIRLSDPKSTAAMAVGIALGPIMFLSAFEVAQFSVSPYRFLPAVVGLALAPASLAIRRRDPEAARALRRWQAFRRYLLDFSRISEQTAPAVAVWDKYMVFAITLGVAEEAAAQFSQVHRQIAEIGLADSYLWPVHAFTWGLSVAFGFRRLEDGEGPPAQ